MSATPLDRAVWSALTTGWVALAQGDARAWRLRPEIGPFAAARDGSMESMQALAALVPAHGELWLVETESAPPPPGTRVLRTAGVAQMVAERLLTGPVPGAAVPLGEADGAEMRALAMLTRPGPFEVETWRLGGFVGVRDGGGRLIAMAGERMRLPGFAEVSGVCTHPEARGGGLAGGLMRIVMARIAARGETPFLHAYAAHGGTIALYERLGFAVRRELVLTVIARA